jgi:hypothetical protein
MAAERRREERQRRRLTCQVLHEGKHFRGIVIDLSSTGLFIQTTIPIPNGSEIVVEFPDQGGRPAFEVRARVARRRRVPPRLASLMPSGLGLRVLDPSEAYAGLVRREEAAETAAEEKRAEDGPALTKYRIRITRRGSPRSRTLVLEAASEEEARVRVARDLGDGWDVVELEES